MYAGFILPKLVFDSAGIHQRLDIAAYRMIAQYLADEAFPDVESILNFEGFNGPDGIKAKMSGLKLSQLKPKGNLPAETDVQVPSHMYDPVTDEGDVPRHVATHYDGLVKSLVAGDMVRASFEAAWLAHFVGDGLTPAHHFPLEAKIAEAAAKAKGDLTAGRFTKFSGAIKKNWEIWGAKGHMSTHQNFELGIAFALIAFPIKPKFSDEELSRARLLGPVEYFKAESREVAALSLYERFYASGWNNDIVFTVKNVLAPQVARTIGILWLLALLEAGEQLATTAAAELAA